MQRRFPSIKEPEKYGYLLDTEAYRVPVNGVYPNFLMYETLGDSQIQHTPERPISTDHLADYLASLTAAMLAGPAIPDQDALDRQNLLINAVRYPLTRRPTVAEMEFAASIIFKPLTVGNAYEKRTRFYSVNDGLKITTQAGKLYDNRYRKVEEWCDGSFAAIFRILTETESNIYRFTAYTYAYTIREWLHQQPGRCYMVQNAATFLNWYGFSEKSANDTSRANLLDCAYEAAYAVVKAHEHVLNAKSLLQALRNTWTNALPESEQVA
jgi:hypothetical protein